MSDTPRTDAAKIPWDNRDSDGQEIIQLCYELERENAALRKALWKLTDAVESVVCDCEGAVAHIFEREPGDKWRVQVALDRARQVRATISITEDLE